MRVGIGKLSINREIPFPYMDNAASVAIVFAIVKHRIDVIRNQDALGVKRLRAI